MSVLAIVNYDGANELFKKMLLAVHIGIVLPRVMGSSGLSFACFLPLPFRSSLQLPGGSLIVPRNC